MFNTYKTITRIIFTLTPGGDVDIPAGDQKLCEKYNVNPLNHIGDISVNPGYSYLVVLEVVKKMFRKAEVAVDIVIPF